MSKVSQHEIESLIELFDKSAWRELSARGEAIELFLSKDPHARRPSDRFVPQSAAELPASPEMPVVTAPPAAKPVPRSRPVHWFAVRAPSVGTFYSAPTPGASLFVEVGQHVSQETQIGLLKVMNVFTAVRAGIAGLVRERLVADTQLVEFDQALYYIEPDVRPD